LATLVEDPAVDLEVEAEAEVAAEVEGEEEAGVNRILIGLISRHRV
jgi:hypothetical protein